MTDVSSMVFVLHLIIVLNWGLQSKCCQNDSGPRITLSIKMQARRGLQGSEACSHGWVTHAEVACSSPNRQQHAGATAFWFCLAGFADQWKVMEIPSSQKAVALKQLLFFPFFFFFCYPTCQTTECLFIETDCNKKTVDTNSSDSFQARNVIWR